MCGRRLNCNWRNLSVCIADIHLRLSGGQGGPIDRPVRSVVVCQPFIRPEPRAVGVDALDCISKVAGQAAVLSQKILPAAAIVTTVSEVGRNPYNLVYVAYRSRDLVNQAFIFKEYDFCLAIRIVVPLPS